MRVTRHVVLFRWRDDATEEDIEAVTNELRFLPTLISEVRRFSFGCDGRLSEENYDLAVIADFDDGESYQRYAAHPAHVAFLEKRLARVLADRAAVQFTVDSEGDGSAEVGSDPGQGGWVAKT